MGKKAPDPKARFKVYLQSELEAAALYSDLADGEKDKSRAQIFREMVEAEMRHAAHWARKLGIEPSTLKPRRNFRARLIAWSARRFGTKAALPLILRSEMADIMTYAKDPEARFVVGDEKQHAQALGGMAGSSPQAAVESEGRHRAGSAGNIRAAVLGSNDGLVSNFALIMGVSVETSDSRLILLAGVAGLLAGAFSMAAGEYLSVRAQRDIYEREIEIERAEIAESPQDEKEELTLIYQAKGLTREEAQAVSSRILANQGVTLSTMVKEELGFDPEQMGSPLAVALSSLTAFSIGAFIPLLPHLVASGTLALALSAVLGGLALFGVGALLSVLSNKGFLWGGIRMLLIGVVSAGVTFGVGRLIGVSVS